MSTKRREYEYGRIVSVDIVPLGDNLAADVSAGASSITVEDACDFDEDGGQLLLAGVVYAYTTWTEDESTGTGTISGLTPTLAANATEGTVVAVYDPMYATAATDKVAQVEVVGDDGNVDTLEADIALHLVDKIDEGVRGPNGEQVKLELEGDEWVVVDIFGLGDPDATGTLAFQDSATATGPGTMTLPLTYEPIQHSEHLYWGGLYQPGTEWTRDGQTITIPDPSSIIVASDEFVVEYLYRKGVTNPAVLPTPITDLPGLVAYYRLAEPSGTTVVDSKSGWNGTYAGSPTLGQPSLVVGGDASILLNGTTQWGEIPAGSWLHTLNAISVGVTFKVTNFSDYHAIVCNDEYPSSRNWTIRTNPSGQLEVWVNGGVGLVTVPIATNTVYRCVWTYDHVTMKLFVNGVLAGSTAYAGAANSQIIATMTIGVCRAAPSGDFAFPFPGGIDEVFVCDGALSDSLAIEASTP